MSERKHALIKKAFLKSLPVLAGYVVLGTGFGILLRNAGYGIWWSFAMAVLIYAGSMQYVGVGLLAGGASVLTTAFTTFMVNARHLFYGISMIDRYKDSGKYKPYLIFALTDETYCLRDVTITEPPFGLVELTAGACVVLLQALKRNSLLSILAGTAVYMVLIRFV